MSEIALETIRTPPPIAAAVTATPHSAKLVNEQTSGTAVPTTTSQVASDNVDPSRNTTALVVFCVACVSGIGALLSGLVTVGIPAMAADTRLEQSLELWPMSIYSLVMACTILISGSIGDVLGNRSMYLSGCFLQSIFTLATGLSRTGTQLIVFRAFSGLASSFCFPSSIALITTNIPRGKAQNIAFAAMGGAQPIGFGLGLTLGGVLTGTIGWRWGFHIASIINTISFFLAVWLLPHNSDQMSWAVRGKKLAHQIDWIGGVIASTGLAMLSYFLADITTSLDAITSPTNLVLLGFSVILLACFPLWQHYATRANPPRPTLIPNSLWRSKVFSSICLSVLLIWGAFNAVEQLLTFYFHYVQRLSPLQSAVRFLPEPLCGGLINILTGTLVHRVRADFIVYGATIASCVPPLLMALAKPSWSYWASSFPSVTVSPVGSDALFTVANLLITQAFPEKDKQGVAGGVFFTSSQVGKSMGLALTSVLANAASQSKDEKLYRAMDPIVLLEGYRAAFWFCFAISVAAVIVGVVGLSGIGRVGLKRD